MTTCNTAQMTDDYECECIDICSRWQLELARESVKCPEVIYADIIHNSSAISMLHQPNTIQNYNIYLSSSFNNYYLPFTDKLTDSHQLSDN